MALPTDINQLPTDDLSQQEEPGQQRVQQPTTTQQALAPKSNITKAPVQPVHQDPRNAPYQPKQQATDFTDQIEFMKDILESMVSGAVVRPLLSGDTGLGKTSFVKQFGKMIGIPLVIIEVPHIVEEELINIPFLVKMPDGKSMSGIENFNKEKDPQTVSTTQYGIELSESYLASTLERLHKQSASEYAASVAQFDNHTKELLTQFNQEYPKLIPSVRSKVERILFLDEYYRQTTPTIRNILREILNRKIGNDKVPEGTFELYASNVVDSGLETKSSQHSSFAQMKFPAPTVQQWLSYMVSGDKNSKVPFKKDVIEAFAKAVKDEHLSFTDADSEIRTSPRRWSEILLYVNNTYPFKDASEASIVKTTMSRQFKTDDDKISPVESVLNEFLDVLIAKSGVDTKKIKSVPTSQWRDVLVHNVMTKIAIGERKKYVPVVQGPPGIGKTAIAEAFENSEYNLRFIDVKCTSLSHDSVTGIPTADNSEKGIKTNFTEPPLYKMIMQQVTEESAGYLNDLKAQEAAGELGGQTADDVYNAWENQEYKYLIFFDEINRVKNPSVFNALRRVILEKEFNDKFKLPAGSVVVGAMNPGDENTTKLTGHFKDAIEVIDAAADWKGFIGHLEKDVIPSVARADYKPDETSIKTAYNIISRFPDVFSNSGSDAKGRKKPDAEFYINIGQADTVYISPRDFTQLFKNLVLTVNTQIDSIQAKINQGQPVGEEEANNRIVNAAYRKMEHIFNHIFHINGQDEPPGFMERVRHFLHQNVDVSFKKTVTQAGLGSMLEQHITTDTPLADDPNFSNYMDDYSPVEFHKDFDKFMQAATEQFMDETTITDIEAFNKFFFGKDKGSISEIANAIGEAIVENGYEQGALDQVRLVSNKFFKIANKILAEQDAAGDDAIIALLDMYNSINELS